MLEKILSYCELISTILQAQHAIGSDGRALVTASSLHIMGTFNKFLKIFYDCTVLLSGVYYPTANLILHNLLEIASLLREHENNALAGDAIFFMKKKYLKYWKEIPMLYALAFILDPRAKMKGLYNLLALIGEVVDVDYSSCYSNVKTQLFEIFGKYENKFKASRLQRPPAIPTSGKMNLQ